MIVTHAILTRYALQMAGRPLPSEKWHRHRRRLFEQFCLPSIQRQTVKDFVWLLFTHPDDPAMRHVLQEWRQQCPQLVPVLTAEPWENFNGAMRAAVCAHLKPGSTHIITTRLDNDDAIAPDFVALVQAQCEGLPVRRFVNFDVGQNFETQSGLTISHRHPCNMFVSCIEPVEQFRGVLTWEHNSIEGVAHVIRPPFERRWTHIVHPYNAYQRPMDA